MKYHLDYAILAVLFALALYFFVRMYNLEDIHEPKFIEELQYEHVPAEEQIRRFQEEEDGRGTENEKIFPDSRSHIHFSYN